jgi:FixJ family two-component response regulator
MTPAAEATVFVIDDDARMRAAMERLLKSVGLRAESFSTPQDFLRSKPPDGPSCLVLDVRLPGMSGLDVQRKLIDSGIHIPIIFISGHGDIPMTVKAMKSGAVEFLTKPFRDQDLLDAIQQALERENETRQQRHDTDIAATDSALSLNSFAALVRPIRGTPSLQDFPLFLLLCNYTS